MRSEKAQWTTPETCYMVAEVGRFTAETRLTSQTWTEKNRACAAEDGEKIRGLGMQGGQPGGFAGTGWWVQPSYLWQWPQETWWTATSPAAPGYVQSWTEWRAPGPAANSNNEEPLKPFARRQQQKMESSNASANRNVRLGDNKWIQQ